MQCVTLEWDHFNQNATQPACIHNHIRFPLVFVSVESLKLTSHRQSGLSLDEFMPRLALQKTDKPGKSQLPSFFRENEKKRKTKFIGGRRENCYLRILIMDDHLIIL